MDALLQRIYAEPYNSALRHVYADILLERGDPRGEFIALQLKRGTIGTPSEREKILVQRHQAEWLGALAGKIRNPRFEQGFLSECGLVTPLSSTLIGDPQWATVECLNFFDEPDLSMLGELLAHECMRSLRNLSWITWPIFAALHTATSPISVRDIWLSCREPHPIDQSQFQGQSALRNLHSLTLYSSNAPPQEGYSPEQFAWLFEQPLGQGLRHFRTQTALHRVGDWMRLFARTQTLSSLCLGNSQLPDPIWMELRRSSDVFSLEVSITTSQDRVTSKVDLLAYATLIGGAIRSISCPSMRAVKLSMWYDTFDSDAKQLVIKAAQESFGNAVRVDFERYGVRDAHHPNVATATGLRAKKRAK